MKSTRRKNKSKPRFAWKRWFGWTALLGLFAVALLVVVYGFWASSYDISQVKEIPQRSMVYDMNAQLYSRMQGENRIVVKRSEVSSNFVEALLAREDSRFYSHHGVDPIGIARALVRNLGSGSSRQGASTLTQQLARNTFPLGGKNVHRKLLEAFVAMRIEQHYKKDEILENYMNRIYFGSGVYGVETASLSYFGKRAKDLSLSEAAMLAGIIRGPTRFSPRKNLKGAVAQRDQVLERLTKLGKVTQTAADAARETRTLLSKRPRLMLQENYAMEAVREDLDVLLNDAQQADGGMKIFTTIDPALQRAAEQAMEANLRKVEQRPGYAHPKREAFASLPDEERTRTPYLQGAAVVIDNRNGSIRAIVGGRDYTESPFNRARESRRQVGSTFKPFAYATAFQRGLLPGTRVEDGPITRGEIEGAETWHPENSDGVFNSEPLPAEKGLIQSRNTMSVRIGHRAGIKNVVKFAEAAGFQEVPAQPAIYLGGFESTLAEVTAAYTVFPNLGTRREPYIIERIDDANGETIYRASHQAKQVADAAVCWLTTEALAKVMERGGTGAGVKNEGFDRPCAGKTGTTNDYVDAWFVGYTTSLTCGVWVGLDQPKTIVSKGYGAALAMPVWADVMAAAKNDRYPAKPFGGVEAQRCALCSVSGELATGGCESVGTAYSDDLPTSLIPHSPCHLHRGSILTERRRERPRRPAGEGLLRSFRKFFGGR